ncbi:hypothetical protein RO07_23095 [Pandoraea pulmonicola]|uniref:Uncharacterized protein n=1 Tax=Pandoraea pulmonicola TaxID=93221 RepID=A0ABM5S4C9_PANPU|nr:hypothetical protein RO07_23095 [Pandoraea pulmonicola]
MCFVSLSAACLGAAAQTGGDGRFLRDWFAQVAERPGGRGDADSRESRDSRGNTRSGPTRPQPQEVRPQGDLRGDIYNHLREQRQPPPAPAPPAGPSGQPGERKHDRGNRER